MSKKQAAIEAVIRRVFDEEGIGPRHCDTCDEVDHDCGCAPSVLQLMNQRIINHILTGIRAIPAPVPEVSPAPTDPRQGKILERLALLEDFVDGAIAWLRRAKNGPNLTLGNCQNAKAEIKKIRGDVADLIVSPPYLRGLLADVIQQATNATANPYPRSIEFSVSGCRIKITGGPEDSVKMALALREAAELLEVQTDPFDPTPTDPAQGGKETAK